MLWMYQRVFYGNFRNSENRALTDVNARERAILWPFVAAALIMGVAPLIWTRAIDGAAQLRLQRQHRRACHTERTCEPGPHGTSILTDAGERTMIPTTDYIRLLPNSS